MSGDLAAEPGSPGTPAIPVRTLGRTGERVSALGLGGWHLGQPTLPEAESVQIVRAAVDAGITFLDNSWDYNGGASETRMGKALRDGYRERVFLMTKIDGQTRKAAAEQIEELESHLMVSAPERGRRRMKARTKS